MKKVSYGQLRILIRQLTGMKNALLIYGKNAVKAPSCKLQRSVHAIDWSRRETHPTEQV